MPEVESSAMRDTIKLWFPVVALLAISSPLFAHHGAAQFEATKILTLKGTVVEWVWANPHCFLKFDVKDAGGNVAHWVAETSNPPDMINRGWTKGTFKPGDEVTVTVRPVKSGKPIGSVTQVQLSGGKILSAGGKAATATEGNQNSAY
jgi:hypothetical protein